MPNSTDILNKVNWTEWVMMPGAVPTYALPILNFTNDDELNAKSLAN